MTTLIKKLILAIAMVCCMVMGAQAQCNPTSNITLTTQADVNAFAAQYNGCLNLIVQNLNFSGQGTPLDLSVIHIAKITGNVSVGGAYSTSLDVPIIDGEFNISASAYGATDLHFTQPTIITGHLSIFDDGIAPSLTNLNVIQAGSCTISGIFPNLQAFSALQTVNQDLFIAAGTTTSGLNNLTSIGGQLHIGGGGGITNTNIEQVEGFDALTSVNGIYINDCANLQSINAFGINTIMAASLNNVGDLMIQNNPVLQTIAGFDNLQSCGTNLYIENNQNLSSIAGFYNLNHLDNTHTTIGTNNNLQQVAAFANLQSCGYLELVSLPVINSLIGFDNLQTASTLNINTTPLSNLNDFMGLEVSALMLFNNNNLNDINAISAITGGLVILNNPFLAVCNTVAVCNFLSLNPVGSANISGNAPNCDSEQTVRAQCGTPPICNVYAYIAGNTNVCSGSTTQICATPSGGCTPYTYVWSNGATTNCINAYTGCYEVTVTDCNGCTFIVNTCVFQMDASITGSTTVCAGQTTSLCANAINGAAPFTYLWSDGTTAQYTNATVGTYTVEITDAMGCTASAMHTISSFTPTTHNWYFGYGAGLSFAASSPVNITTPNSVNTWEGTAVAEDANGQLLFYTDGNKVWDACNNLVATLGFGTSSTTQAATVLRVVGNANQFYIFSVEDVNTTNRYAHYTIVNISGGIITVGTPTVLSAFDTGESLTIMPHENGIDSWVITGKRTTDELYAYLVSSAGVSSTPVISTTGVTNGFGYSKVHCREALIARAYAIGGGTSGGNGWAVYNMDKTTGAITLKHNFTALSYFYPYGVEFAPSGKLLYGSDAKGGGLYQFNLGTFQQTATWNSYATAGSYNNSGALQIGPDNKIYMAADGHQSIHVINNPDNGGAAANFAANSVVLTHNSGIGLPSIPVAACTQPIIIATQNTVNTTNTMTLQPNPTNGIVHLLLNRLSETEMIVTISNLQGIELAKQKIYKGTATTEFDLSQYPSGLYLISMLTADGERITQKIVKE
jgi:Secretion system C-terminal sorting domain